MDSSKLRSQVAAKAQHHAAFPALAPAAQPLRPPPASSGQSHTSHHVLHRLALMLVGQSRLPGSRMHLELTWRCVKLAQGSHFERFGKLDGPATKLSLCL